MCCVREKKSTFSIFFSLGVVFIGFFVHFGYSSLSFFIVVVELDVTVSTALFVHLVSMWCICEIVASMSILGESETCLAVCVFVVFVDVCYLHSFCLH